MAVSGTVIFTMNRDELITDSLVDIGAIALGATPTTAQIAHASSRLNTMIKAWQGERIYLYAVTTASLTCSSAYASLPTDYRRTISVTIVEDGVTRILTPLSQEEHDAIVLKTTAAKPNSYYIDEPLGRIYYYPVPDQSYSCTIRYETILDDVTSATDNFDLPSTALDMLMKGLAYELAVPYGLPTDRVQTAMGRAMKAKSDYIIHANQEFNGTEVKVPKGVNII